MKENLQAQVFQSLLVRPIITATNPDGTFVSYQGEDTPGRIRKQLIVSSEDENEVICTQRDTQSIGGLLLNFEMREGAESDEVEEIIPVSSAPTTIEDSSDEEDYGSDNENWTCFGLQSRGGVELWWWSGDLRWEIVHLDLNKASVISISILIQRKRPKNKTPRSKFLI